MTLTTSPSEPKPSAPAGWVLVWSDDFDGPAGAAPHPATWSHDLGDGCAAGNCGWGNQEKQAYSDSADNVALTGNGRLAITARVAPPGQVCYYGPCRYTSGKIKTKAKLQPQYGRIEARLQLPPGQGLWPAFWLLGAGPPAVPWPECGEIDIMEYRGSQPKAMSSAVHGPGYFRDTPLVHAFTLTDGTFADSLHVFALEWEPAELRFYVDEVLHYTLPKSAVLAHGPWVFDQPFYLILNLAVGGHFDGDPASDSIFPATMLVDYVRVYARGAPA